MDNGLKHDPKFRARFSDVLHGIKPGSGRNERRYYEFCIKCSEPAFLYVFPLRRMTGQDSRQMNRLLRQMQIPSGVFCEQCYEQFSVQLELASEVIKGWNLTREMESYVKGKAPRPPRT